MRSFASDNLCMTFPYIVDGLGFSLSIDERDGCFQLRHRSLLVHILTAFLGTDCTQAGGNINGSYTGFYFVYILAAFSAAVEAFHADVPVGADIFRFRYDADIHKPVFTLVVWAERAFTNPLDASFQM